MHGLLVAFTTYDGHTAKLAERIASSLREDDCADEVCDLARLRPERPVHEYDGVIGGGPTRCPNELLDETGWKPNATAKEA